MLRLTSLFVMLFTTNGLYAQTISDTAQVLVQEGATLFVSGNIYNAGILSGPATVQGNLNNTNTLKLGTSPTKVTVTGEYRATETAVQNFKVGGTTETNYDQLNVNGGVHLNGTLNVSLINGFTGPQSNPDLYLINGNINGTFATVNKPPGYVLIYNQSSVVLRYDGSLPVTFMNVDAKKQGTEVKILWTIQNELNVQTYDIEKSRDGREFRKIGTQKAAFLSKYNFTDYIVGAKPFTGLRALTTMESTHTALLSPTILVEVL